MQNIMNLLFLWKFEFISFYFHKIKNLKSAKEIWIKFQIVFVLNRFIA